MKEPLPPVGLEPCKKAMVPLHTAGITVNESFCMGELQSCAFAEYCKNKQAQIMEKMADAGEEQMDLKVLLCGFEYGTITFGSYCY